MFFSTLEAGDACDYYPIKEEDVSPAATGRISQARGGIELKGRLAQLVRAPDS